MILATLALLCLARGGDPAREAGELHTYDLQTLLVPYRQEFQLQVLPLRGIAGGTEERERFDAGLVIELLRSLCRPEFEYEGRSLEEQDGTLYVTAPAPVQEKIGKILGFLGSALGARTELAIDELILPDGLAKDPAPILAPDEAQKLLAGSALHRSWRVSLRPGWAGAVLAQKPISFVADWNVEIAQGAAIHDPLVDVVAAGDALACSGAPAPGGLWLALLARGGESAGPKDHPLEVFASVASETTPIPNPQPNSPGSRSSGRVLQAGPRVWQSVPVALHALALNTFLPDGKVLCLSSTLGVGEPRGTRLLLLRRTGPGGAPVQGLSLDPKGAGGRDLVLVDAGWLRPPQCTTEGDLRGGGALPIVQNDVQEGALRFLLQGVNSGRAHERLADLNGCEIFDSAAWLVVARSQRAAEGSGPDAAVARLGSSALLPQSFSAELALRRGGNVVARATLALRSGATSTVVSGAEDELLCDWDVEVAQGASVADPVIRPSFEGLCARLRVERDPAGALVLDIRGFGQARNGELRNLDPQVPTVGAMTLGIWDRMDVEERLTLAADGPKKALFGDSGGSGLQLEVTLGELK